MTKNEFIQHHSIADASPLDPSKRALPAEAFSVAILEFMENKFKGAIKVECDNISAQSILICAEYVALFFKTLLIDVYGRVFLHLKIYSDEGGLHMNITADGELPLTDMEMRDLIRQARNGGLDILPDENSIKLSASFHPAVFKRVYAVSIMDGRRIMLGKLVEIFCHGELFNPDPPPPPPSPAPIKKKVTKNKNNK